MPAAGETSAGYQRQQGGLDSVSSLDFAVAAVAVCCEVDFSHEIQAAGMAQWYAVRFLTFRLTNY